MYSSMGKTPKELSQGTNVSISLASGVVAGVAAAIISHPGAFPRCYSAPVLGASPLPVSLPLTLIGSAYPDWFRLP